MRRRLLTLCIILCSNFLLNNTLFAQSSDSLKKVVNQNTVVTAKVKSYDSNAAYIKFKTQNYIPKRAAMYSALLPGLGQYYTKSYWRIPIAYAGFGAAAWYATTQSRNYRKFQTAYIYRVDNNPATIDSFETQGKYTINDLLEQRSKARRNLDKVGVYASVWYLLNIVDAMVGAHLKTFDVSKSLSLKLQPSILQQNSFGVSAIVTVKPVKK